jgi:alkanesulfonate monooxygenase SsuD/methylene tetrahydromethanopterin reductase-like flavin-dependent oxidoreductase (luciferase family)
MEPTSAVWLSVISIEAASIPAVCSTPAGRARRIRPSCLQSPPMDLGVCMAAKIDDVGYAVLAEQLGYSHLWVADSQMIWSDCYATLALVADRTSRIRIGTGVAVAGTRPAAVTAAAHATINELAPGRVFCGIGTGNTAMRIMGHAPIPIAEFDEYLSTLKPLLRGDAADVAWRGRRAPARHLMPDAGFVAFEPVIPLYVSAFGARSLALAARHGDGLVTSLPPRPDAVERTWAALDQAAAASGRHLDRSAFLTCTLTTMVVLEPGEPHDSARVKEQCGAFAIAALHYAYEQWRQFGRRPPAFAADVWPEYTAMLAAVPDDRLHLRIHEGHNCWVVPEEERFVTADLIDATCLVGTAAELAGRLRDLECAGLSQVMLLPPLASKESVLRDVAEQVMPLL